MSDILQTVSVISFVAAGVFVCLAIMFWFVFNIPSVVGDLSGRTARKAIEKMRQHNEKTGKKYYKTGEKNLERGKLTGTMEGLSPISSNCNEETGLLNENSVHKYEEKETGLLIDDNATGLLSDSGETASLEENTQVISRLPSTVAIRLISEVIYIHTEEVI